LQMIDRMDLIIKIEGYEKGNKASTQQPQPINSGIDGSHQQEAKKEKNESEYKRLQAPTKAKSKLCVMHEGNTFEVELFITTSMEQFCAELSKEMNIKGRFTLQFQNELKIWIVLQKLDQLSRTSLIKIIPENLEEVEFGVEIARGGYSIVYRGTWSGTEVAIKVLKNQNFPEAFTREMKKFKTLNHPHVIQYFGICLNDDNERGIITEVADGDLFHMLQEKKIEEAAFIKICKDVAAGMMYLSSNKIVHRDLAARNILLMKSDGPNFIAKVADFGLSASSYSLKSKVELSRMEFATRWTAPEALQNDHWSEKSDVWSFGILLFEIFTYGQRPYSDISDDNIVRDKVISGLTPTYPATCSEDVKKIMNSCWKIIPQQRNNFKSIHSQLEDILAI